MTNMSYCRFQNTLLDLRDCREALLNLEPMSKEEFSALKSMAPVLTEMVQHLLEYDIIRKTTYEEFIATREPQEQEDY